MSPVLRTLALAPLPLLLAGCIVEVGSRADDDRGLATPVRPTVSASTATAEAGQLQVEAGLALDPGDVFDSPLTVRYGNTETQELFLGWSPLQWADVPGADEHRMGDVLLGVRQRVLEETDEEPSIAWQLAARLPTGGEDPPLSSGETDVLAAGIATKRIEDYEVTAFYQMGFLGEVGDDGLDLEHTLALAGTGPQVGEIQPVLELAGIFTPERDLEQVLATIGAYHRVSRSLVVDGGFVVGLTDDAPDFVLFVGVTSSAGYVTPLRQLREDGFR